MIWLLFWSTSVWAQEYEQRVQSLQKSQTEVERVLNRLGRRVGSSTDFTPRGDLGGGTNPSGGKPLFQQHTPFVQTRIPAGKLVFGKLINRLVVGAEASPALVELSEGQGALSGRRIQGTARQSGTEGRVAIEFQRLLSTSAARTIQAVALDTEGAYGMPAQVLSSKMLAVAGAMASSFVSGLAAGQQTQATSAFGFSQVQPTGRNAILQGVAQSAADQSKRLIEEATQEKPVLMIEALSPVTVLIQEEVQW